MLKRIMFSAALLLIVLSGCGGQEDSKEKDHSAAKVSVMALKTQNIQTSIEFSATSVASRPVQIRARVEGYLQSRHYREGSFVRAGERLFTIDQKPFLLAVSSAEAVLDGEIAKKENATQNLKRVRMLFNQQASGQQELDAAIALERTQSALVNAAKAALGQAKLNLSYTTIQAPISGWADKVTQYEGSYITPSQNGLLTTIYQSNPIYIDFSVNAQSMVRIKKAIHSSNGILMVDVILPDGELHPHKGKISYFSPTVDTQSGTRMVRAELSNPNADLIPGEFVKVRVNTRLEDAILIPHKALMQGPKGTFVYVVDVNMKAEARAVKVGEWISHEAVILEGLSAGEQIIYEGTSRVDAGKTVKIATSKKAQ